MVRLVNLKVIKTKNAPTKAATKERRRLDKAFNTLANSEESEFYNHLSPEAKKKFKEAMENIQKMTPAERKQFYAENSIWIAKVFNYKEVDEEGNETGAYVGKNQLGKKVGALLRATQKQYTLNDMKSMAKHRAAKAAKVKVSKPKKVKASRKLTAEDVDRQIADLERQIELLKQIKAGL